MDTLHNNPNAVNIQYIKKHFGSHSNTRNNEKILNISRSEIEEVIKSAKCRKAPAVVDIIGGGTEDGYNRLRAKVLL